MKPELAQKGIQESNQPSLNLVVNNMPQEIRDRDSLTNGISLMYPIALMNHDSSLQKAYFEPSKGKVTAGFRRQVANFGVCYVCADFGSDKEIMVGKNDYRTYNGAFNYITKEYEEIPGLPGSEVKEGHKEVVHVEEGLKKIDAIRDIVEARYEVQISPYTIYKFIESRKKRELGDTFRDRKFNIQFTAGLPANTAKATAEVTPEGIIMVTPVPTLGGGVKLIKSLVDPKLSVVSEKKIQPGRVYLIKPVSFDKKTGTRTVNVLRMYVEGVRVGMQAFKMGLIKPGDKAYDVNPDSTNGITVKTVMDMPFAKVQDKRKIMGAPMLTIDLDMMFSLMHTLSGYPVVTMKFKDSSSGIYFKAEGNDYLPNIEAIIGPTIQYVRGRVWLP